MRIGINVPNELLRQVKKITPKVNVSRVCREALQARIDVAQRAAGQSQRDGMSEQVYRLDESRTKRPIEPDWEDLAFIDARDWVRGISSEAWELFLHQCNVLKRQGRDENEMVPSWSRDHGAKGLGHHLSENDDWLISQLEMDFDYGINSNPMGEATEKYGRAWLAYVHEVRRLLDERRKEEYDRIMAERAAALKSRPAPDVPQQLI